MTTTRWTDDDFDELSWHDCHIHGLRFIVGDPARGDWTADLALDLDYITEWVCGVDGRATFLVAPATLTFHGVISPRLALDWRAGGYPTTLHPASISQITRTPTDAGFDNGAPPSYHWQIELNWPAGGVIAFDASGFTQTLRAAPVASREQMLYRDQRPA